MELHRVDLRGLEPGAPGWEDARAAVAASMTAHGCVVVVDGGLAPALRDTLFGRVLPELFALPRDVKLRNTPGAPPHAGYLFHGVQESVRVDHADRPGAVSAFADLLWPDGGNPLFCDAVRALAREMRRLESTVVSMVLESMGVPERVAASPLAAMNLVVRLNHYGARPDPVANNGGQSMAPHYDYCLATVVVQYDVEGLEVQAKDGRWLAVPPETDTYVVMAGELLKLMTNGRVPACMHRVRTPSGRERFVALVSPLPAGTVTGAVVRVLDELVDGDHPRLYRPIDLEAYVRFKYSDEGRELGNRTLEAFCGDSGAKNGGNGAETWTDAG